MNKKDTKNNESRILFKMVRERYGSRLTPAELKVVRKEVGAIVEIAKVLRSVKLENSVEPFSVFKPYRKEE